MEKKHKKPEKKEHKPGKKSYLEVDALAAKTHANVHRTLRGIRHF